MPELSIYEINELQKNIMLLIVLWARKQRTPIPQKEVVIRMKEEGVKNFTTVNALYSLVKKGYIRRAHTISNKTFYVMLRSV